MEWSETARLARRDLLELGPPVLITIALVWAASILRARRARGAAAGPSGVPGPGAGRIAGSPRLLAGAVLAGWAAGLSLLLAAGFSPKVGWVLGAILLGILAGAAATRLSSPGGPAAGRAAGGEARVAAFAGAATAILWSASWIVPAAADGALPAAAPAAGGAPASVRAPAPGAVAPAGLDPGGAAVGPGIVLIVIDALRADHLGAYGYARPTSPSLDALAAEGVLFQEAIAPAPWTLPAMASILTSSYTGQHGVAEKGDVLSRDLDDLASLLRGAGYVTAAFTTNPWLKRAFGFDDGFDPYYDLDRLGLERHLLGVRLRNMALRLMRRIRLDPELVPEAEDLTGRALRWLRGNSGRPFFLYLHYMDVHAPYDPVAPYHGRICRGHRFDEPDHLLESRFRSGRHAGDAAVLEHVVELYDEDILATDAAIGRLVSGMAAAGLLATTHLILTADHGEEFYDHGGTTHGRSLYQELIRVPLIVRPARAGGRGAEGRPGAGRVVPDRVSTLDVLPTVLDLAGAPRAARIEGISLAGLLGGGEAGPGPRPVGSHLFLDERAWSALLVGGEKLIRVRPKASDPAAPSDVKLFRLDTDPAERADAAASDPALTSALLSALDGFEQVWGIPGLGGKRPGEPIDPETLRQLKALGYVN
jgi:arylsulfatase